MIKDFRCADWVDKCIGLFCLGAATVGFGIGALMFKSVLGLD